jgi:O-antigen/teichoic acid export membrane protein
MEPSTTIDESLRKVAGGTSIVLFGTVVGMLLGFAGRVIVVRYITQSEYGMFMLASVLASAFTMAATLGLPQGMTRYIAYFRGRNELARIRGIVFSSLRFASVSGIALSVILFLIADILSEQAFHNPELATPLRILAVTIPCSVLVNLLIAFYRGCDRVEVKAYFHDILHGALVPALVGLVILFGWAFHGVIYAHLAAAVITCLALVAYTATRPPLHLKHIAGVSAVGRQLLLFSFPLLIQSMLATIIQWTDTIMLGYFKTSGDVGLYNAALPLARFIPIPLASMAFVYVPVASLLYSRGLKHEIKRSYQILTKWVFSLSLPIFMLLLLFPGQILSLFFGPQYDEAALALRILSLGFLVHTFLGVNGMTLVVMGQTRPLLWTGLTAALLNIALNTTLIPLWGVTGAAVASLASYCVANVLNSAKLYQLSRIHPFTRNYVKPIVASVISILVVYAVATNLFAVKFWMLPLFFVFFLAAYGLSLLLTRSFDKEDIMLLLEIEKRSGIDATPLKRLLRRFI